MVLERGYWMVVQDRCRLGSLLLTPEFNTNILLLKEACLVRGSNVCEGSTCRFKPSEIVTVVNDRLTVSR